MPPGRLSDSRAAAGVLTAHGWLFFPGCLVVGGGGGLKEGGREEGRDEDGIWVLRGEDWKGWRVVYVCMYLDSGHASFWFWRWGGGANGRNQFSWCVACVIRYWKYASGILRA